MALERADIVIEHTGETFSVSFNPEEYSINQENNFAVQNVVGRSAPLLQFTHGNMRTLQMELFFDTSDARTDVRQSMQRLMRLLAIDGELHAPPVVRVTWGTLDFRCVLASANQTYLRFLPDGRPVRARVNAVFNEFIDLDQESREVNRQTANFSKVHVARDGELLTQIASQYYQDPTMWRAIALENEIDAPRAELTGRALRIPPLPYARPDTGEVLA